uniref:Uncharacterized protein n=1 Tax=Mustela putorius furo TaxID=9669 RepID=M3XVW8_MUSPF
MAPWIWLPGLPPPPPQLHTYLLSSSAMKTPMSWCTMDSTRSLFSALECMSLKSYSPSILSGKPSTWYTAGSSICVGRKEGRKGKAGHLLWKPS